MMKLSDNTVDILKNFSNINQNILIKQGNKLRTMSTMRNILAEADVTETFPKDFGVYDLNEFLGVLTLTKEPDLNFDNDSFLVAKSGATNIKYFYSDPSILTIPPETFNPPEFNVTFSMPEKTLASVLKASAVMQLPDIVMSSDGTPGIKITATDLKNTSSNNFTEVLDVDAIPFEFRFKAENLKMIPGEYVLHGSKAGVSYWVGSKASYWIAMEQQDD